MASIGDIFWAFRGDGTKLQADAKKEGAAAGTTLGSSMVGNIKKSFTGANIGKGLAQGLGIAGAFSAVNLASGAASKAVEFIGDAISKASDLSESLSKTKVVFGDSADAMVKWSSTAARTMGLSQQAALEASGTIGNLLLSMGKTPAVAADMSRTMVQLAADLASFNNVDIEEVLTAMRSGLTGEIAPLRRFGVNLSDAALKAKAMALGLSDGKGVLDASAKSQAAYALILEQTTTAQGDFARTSDGLANKQRSLNAAIDDLQAALGTALLPVVTDTTDGLLRLVEAINDTGDAARDNEDPIDNLANLIHDIFKKPDEDPRTFFGALAGGLDDLNDNVGDAAAGINDFWTFWDDHSRLAERRANRLGSTFTDLKDTTAADFEGMRGVVMDKTAAVRIAVDDTAANMEVNRGRMVGALAKVSKSFTTTAKLSDTAMSRMRDSWGRTADYIEARANELISDAFDPIIARDDLVADNIEANALRKTIAIKATTDAQKTAAREARSALDSLMRDTATQLTTLAAAGQSNSSAFKTGLANLQTYAAGLKGSAKTSVDAAIAEILRLTHIKLNPIDVPIRVPVISVRTTYDPNSGPHVVSSQQGWRIYDRGGRPDPFVPALIGKGQYQEMFIPDRPGTIVPHDQTQRMLGGTTTVGPIYVTAGADTSLSSARRWGQVILDEVAAGLREQTARSGNEG